MDKQTSNPFVAGHVLPLNTPSPLLFRGWRPRQVCVHSFFAHVFGSRQRSTWELAPTAAEEAYANGTTSSHCPAQGILSSAGQVSSQSGGVQRSRSLPIGPKLPVTNWSRVCAWVVELFQFNVAKFDSTISWGNFRGKSTNTFESFCVAVPPSRTKNGKSQPREPPVN